MSKRDEIVLLWGPWITALVLFLLWGQLDPSREMMPLILIICTSIAAIPQVILVLLLGSDPTREFVAVLLSLVLGTLFSTICRSQYLNPRVVSYFLLGSYIMVGPLVWYLMSGAWVSKWFLNRFSFDTVAA